MKKPLYRAVNVDQLIGALGKGCSPMANRDGYVIGPDMYGRLCHVSTHFTLREAQIKAEILNNRKGNDYG